MAAEGVRVEQRHGKARVRVGRVWRQGGDGSHHFVEWNVSISLLSHCLSSYHRDDNSDIVATDTMKNTVSHSKKQTKTFLTNLDSKKRQKALMFVLHHLTVSSRIFS